MSRLRIRHVTGFRYRGDASLSYNEARMLPASRPGQFVVSSHLEVEPHVPVQMYTDYWGTRVAAFEVLAPHTELRITAESVVEVRTRPQAAPRVGWEGIERASARSVSLLEQQQFTALTTPHAEIEDLAAEYRAAGGDPIATASGILESVRDAFVYDSDATGVRTTAAEAWSQRRGVSQDFVHIGLSALRSVGIPARYVSGYFHADRDSPLGTTCPGDSHAWVEFWDGDWRSWSTATGGALDERQIGVGHGRDYTDVSPLRGIYAGSDESELFVSVETTREA